MGKHLKQALAFCVCPQVPELVKWIIEDKRQANAGIARKQKC